MNADEVPIAETEEIVLPTSGGSACAEGIVTTHLIGGETTLALTLSGAEVALTVGHEADGIQSEATATLSSDDLRALRGEIDAVLKSRQECDTE